VVLDVCGAGATTLRDRKCLELLKQVRINVIKGNASEVARVSGESVKTRGVDATEVSGDLVMVAEKLADQRKATVAITGKVDIVTDGKTTYLVKNGHPMMTHVVGTGCMATSVIGAFAAVESDLSLASACALACYEIAAEVAAERVSGPASFKERLFDCLYNLDRETVDRMQRIETCQRSLQGD
jgi:hydroxyethylthiazole kinase